MKSLDQDIITTFRNNDELGLELLFKSYYRPLCVYAIKFVDDIHDAEDIVQEIFLRFWEDKKYKNIQDSLKSYLFISVRNRSLNFLTNSKKMNTEYIKHLSDEFTFHQFDEDELEEQKAKLFAEIAKLPPQSQKVLKMIVFDKKKYKEVSEDLGISLNTVKTHFSRALRHLRSVMDVMVIMLFP